MLLAILSICTQEELAESEESEGETPNVQDLAERRQVIKNKILAVGRMQRVFQLLRSVSRFFGR
jgi:serine/threonine-protein phosphatase 2B catalytic subunit